MQLDLRSKSVHAFFFTAVYLSEKAFYQECVLILRLPTEFLPATRYLKLFHNWWLVYKRDQILLFPWNINLITILGSLVLMQLVKHFSTKTIKAHAHLIWKTNSACTGSHLLSSDFKWETVYLEEINVSEMCGNEWSLTSCRHVLRIKRPE